MASAVADGVVVAATTELGVAVVAAQPEVRAITPVMARIAFQRPTLTALSVAMVTSNWWNRAAGADHTVTPC